MYLLRPNDTFINAFTHSVASKSYLKYSPLKLKCQYFYNALRYGAKPHGLNDSLKIVKKDKFPRKICMYLFTF